MKRNAAPHDPKRKAGGKRIIKITILFVIVISIVAASLWTTHLRRLRSDMKNYITDAVVHIEHGRFHTALNDAVEALALSERLRDENSLSEINAYIEIIETVLRGNELFDNGRYSSARNAYLLASSYAADMGVLVSDYLAGMISVTEGYIHFYELIERADHMVEVADYEAALSLYEEAEEAASALSFDDGLVIAVEGAESTKELIDKVKREQAEGLLSRGDHSFSGEKYAEAIRYYNSALEIFLELNDFQNINIASAKIGSAKHMLAIWEEQTNGDSSQEDTDTDSGPDAEEEQKEGQNEIISNYEYNRGLSFDMRSLIDNQNESPANLIKMGSSDGRNEGWYNGCGWVAAYNALIILDNPRHPADIVNYYEMSGGTVLDGVFGTYPQAIEGLFKSLGYHVNHALFPQFSIDIDNSIKTASVSILAYLHTGAAHYTTIVYREADGKYIVYNDSFAQARSKNLGYENYSDIGAVIDSVEALIQYCPDILFSFSLITISP